MRATDITGTYELVTRTLASGKILRRPAIAGLYALANGRANLNLFSRSADDKLASESSIICYTLSASRYCEGIICTVRNNLDAPGITNETPPVEDNCTPVGVEYGKVIFAPPGESDGTIYDRHGFTAGIPGQFVDRWRKVE